MHDILSTLAAEYDPVAIIVYGSFADGTSNLFSDFDALLITRDGPRRHDDRFIDCTQLDVFIYPLSDFQRDYDPAEFQQVFDGQILLDRDGVAAGLIENVNRWLSQRCAKSREELQIEVSWCEKMLRRSGRADTEGSYRRHWLLVDSLRIYTELRAWQYLGPKKALKQLEKKDRAAYALYEKALTENNPQALMDWVAHIRKRFDQGNKKTKKT